MKQSTLQDGSVQDSAHIPNHNPPENGGQTAETPQLRYQVSGHYDVEIKNPVVVCVLYQCAYTANVWRCPFDIEVECDLLSVYQTTKRIISDRENVPLNCVAIGSVKAVSNG